MKIFIGDTVKLKSSDAKHFSRGNFTCRALMETHKGDPVVISQCQSEEFPFWKVEHGFHCMVFATKEEAMSFCKAHYRPLPD